MIIAFFRSMDAEAACGWIWDTAVKEFASRQQKSQLQFESP